MNMWRPEDFGGVSSLLPPLHRAWGWNSAHKVCAAKQLTCWPISLVWFIEEHYFLMWAQVLSLFLLVEIPVVSSLGLFCIKLPEHSSTSLLMYTRLLLFSCAIILLSQSWVAWNSLCSLGWPWALSPTLLPQLPMGWHYRGVPALLSLVWVKFRTIESTHS